MAKNEKHIRRYEHMLSSPAYRDLKPLDRCLLEELQRLWNPTTGQVGIDQRRLKPLLHTTRKTISKSFERLYQHGFIIPVAEYVKERSTRQYRLTFEKHQGRLPTHEWKQWEPEN